MSTAQKVAFEFDEYSDNIAVLSKIALNKMALDIIPALDDNSPVDKGTFRAEWDFKEEDGGPGVAAQVSIFNRMPYAAVIEEGTPQGKKPWATTGSKTIELDGRIWSRQAVGGVVAPVMGDEGGFADKMLDRVNSFVLGGL